MKSVYTNLFDKSNDNLFNKKMSNHVILQLSRNILSKYPSSFFEKWMIKIGVTKTFSTSLIKTIANTSDYNLRQNYVNLLLSLIENNFYTNEHVIHLEKLLLRYNLYYYALFLRMHNKNYTNKIKSTNINYLLGLSKLGIINEHIDNQIFKFKIQNYESISDIYDVVINKMISLTCEEQILLISQLNPEIFQLLVDSNVFIQSPKLIQKLLTYSAINKNILLHIYLIETFDAVPSKSDILNIFGITRTQIKLKKRRRNRSCSTKFKYHTNRNLYTEQFMIQLLDLFNCYNKKNINLSKLSAMKYLVNFLLTENFLEFALELCNFIKYKLNK